MQAHFLREHEKLEKTRICTKTGTGRLSLLPGSIQQGIVGAEAAEKKEKQELLAFLAEERKSEAARAAALARAAPGVAGGRGRVVSRGGRGGARGRGGGRGLWHNARSLVLRGGPSGRAVGP
jgi:hypothetical protein